MTKEFSDFESDDAETAKAEWLERLETLVGSIKTWAEADGWRTRQVGKTIHERRLGTYKAPLLLMEKEGIEAVLNPVARYVPGSAGAVDLYLAPAYDDIASLYYEEGQWVVHHAAPADLNSPVEVEQRTLSEETIRAILDGMVAHA